MGIASKIIKGGLKAVANKAPRMSEALNPHVGKRLYITQADRTALDYDQGLLGGPGYVELAGIDPAKYKDIAWAVQSPGVAKTLVGSMARNPEEAVFANLIGSPEQHRSNKVVFDRIMDRFQKAVEEDKLTPELHATINKRLSNIKDPKTGKSFFPEDVDILSPEFNQHAQTFHQRAFIADILAGKGVGGKKGSIIDYPQVIKETTDPLLLEAKTGDIGDRLFSLSGNIQERPELHPAFHYSLSGKKESEAFAPAPQGIVLKNFTKDFTERTGRLPTYYDLTRGYSPSEKITDEMLERMYKEGYAEGGTVADDAEEYGEQLKEQRKTLGSDILKSGAKGITEGVGNILRSAKETLSRAGTIGDVVQGYGKYAAPMEKARYEGITGKKFPELKPISLLPDQAITESPVGAKILPFTTGEQQFIGEVLGDPLSYSVTGAGRGIKKVGKFIGEGLAEQVQTGRGFIGRNVINPRANIIKDQGGMLVGGEKALDDELIAMKHNESAYPHAQAHYVAGDKDPNAVALNQWVDTKVRKYLRNQAGTEADPILKTIESGVEHNFQPTMGDTKYSVRNKRLQVGKPEAGIAKTELGKEFEYKIDSMFDPKSSEEVKAILNDPLPFADPNTAERFRASKLRTELDLPIQNEKDVEALRLLNEIPDKNVYTLSGTNITDRLGLNHVSDVLMEDLQTGRLRPEQLNQMSIEKAIRRAAEYDAEKAKAMAKANASSVEGMPIPKEYNDGFKWVELKHETDPTKTKAALKSEGEMMGHCVGGYCPDVESGEIKIFSLRSPDGKSHVTIEARPQFSMTLWRNENMDLISRNPELMKLDFNMRSLDNDDKYGRRMTERDYVREMTKEMKKRNINPIEPPSYMELHQVKGKQNKRPDDKYQSYISDFIKNNPTKHEIVDVFELDNTNLMGVQNIADNGLVSKDIHNHPDVEKIVKNYPKENLMAMYKKGNVSRSPMEVDEDIKYNIFKDAAKDLARQNKNYVDKDDILNHLREKYLLPKKKSGGSINLNQEYKLENMRRRYG
jgi:hypothetical protein